MNKIFVSYIVQSQHIFCRDYIAMDFNELYSHTLSPVMRSVLSNDSQLLESLIKEGKFSTDSHDNRGWFPIHHAANVGSIKCLDLLTQQENCNVNWQSHEGMYA